MPKIDISKLPKEITDKYTIKNDAFVNVAKSNPKDLIIREIGDTKDATKFQPQQKIGRWGDTPDDNECNVSVRLVHDEKTPTVTTEGDKIVWSGDKVSAEFYDITNEDHPEGATEFEVILKEKPKTNVVQFTLVDKDVDYFYQAPLTAEEIEQGSQRPENVEGSYAVYAKTPKTNWTGGKEYKCGKVGHIYRPQIEDAEGNKVWGELNIENGILSVTIPQDFLDKAVYPVRHAAGLTFGYTTAGSIGTKITEKVSKFETNDWLNGNDFSSPGAGSVTGLSYNIYSKSVSSNVLIVLNQKDSAGANLHGEVAYATTLAASLTTGWNNNNVSASIVASVTYILHAGGVVATITGIGDVQLAYDTTSARNKYWAQNSGAAHADPWNSTPSSDTKIFSIYATYTAGGGGTTIPIMTNVAGTWKTTTSMLLNVSGTWKSVLSAKVNIAGVWKSIF